MTYAEKRALLEAISFAIVRGYHAGSPAFSMPSRWCARSVSFR